MDKPRRVRGQNPGPQKERVFVMSDESNNKMAGQKRPRQYSKVEKQAVSRYAAMNPGLTFEEIRDHFGYPQKKKVFENWLEEYPFFPDGKPNPGSFRKLKRFTLVERAQILDMVFAEDPVDINGFADRMHIPRATLYNWMHEDPRYSPGYRYTTRYPEETKREVLDYLADNPGTSVNSAARRFGIPSCTVLQWANKDPRITVKSKKMKRYTADQRKKAVAFVRAHPYITAAEAMAKLGYPDDPATLRNWLGLEAQSLLGVKQQYTVFDRIAIVDLLETSGESLEDFCLKHSLNPATVKNWATQFRKGGYVALMRKTDLPRRPDEIPREDSLFEDKDGRIETLEFELDIARSIIDILKKDPGPNGGELTNREKVQIIDSLRPFYKLSKLLKALDMAKSSYFYTRNTLMREDKYADLRPLITEEFASSGCEYGYRRIWYRLRYAHGLIISEKVVRRIMREEELIVRCRKKKRYNSYRGVIGPIPPNIINRNFHADRPFEKLLTDITEFHIDDYRVYLSALIDCFNGECLGYAIGDSPNMDLVIRMLDQASPLISASKPTIHSDRGWHYQNQRYTDYLKSRGWLQSMSKKGCSPDNAAMEGFFGVLKRGFFYTRQFSGMTKEAFMANLAAWIDWFNEGRVKMPLGGLSPRAFRLEYAKMA